MICCSNSKLAAAAAVVQAMLWHSCAESGGHSLMCRVSYCRSRICI